MSDDQVLSGYLYKKGSGLLRRGLVGRTNWKKRYFVLSWADQDRHQASLSYFDSPKAMVRDPSANPLNVIAVTDSTSVSTVSNPNHADKFCFQIVIADEAGDSLAKLEDKFSREELEQYEALFASVDDDGSGSIDVKEVGALLEKLGSKVSSEEELQQIVDEVDEDGSGEIEYSEFLSIMFNLKSGKKSALGDKFGGALKFGFPKGVKSPFKSKQPSNIRQLWSDSEAERSQWILAIEATVLTIKTNKRPAQKEAEVVEKEEEKGGDTDLPADPPHSNQGQGMEEEGGRHRVESGITTTTTATNNRVATKTNTNLASVLEAEETRSNSNNSPNPVKANPVHQSTPSPRSMEEKDGEKVGKVKTGAGGSKPQRSKLGGGGLTSPAPLVPNLLGGAVTPSRITKDKERRASNPAASSVSGSGLGSVTKLVQQQKERKSEEKDISRKDVEASPAPPKAKRTEDLARKSTEASLVMGVGRKAATPERRHVVPTTSVTSAPSLQPVKETGPVASTTPTTATSPSTPVGSVESSMQDLVVQPPSPPVTNTQVTQAPWADDEVSEREARLLREKETLEQQLILIVSMNEELNGTLEAAVKEHDEREQVMKLHLETLAGEVDALKGGHAGSSQVLDDRNSRLEAQIEGLQNMVSTANAEAETVRNRLSRSEGRLLEQGDELKEEQDRVRKLRDKVGVLEGVRDVLESELEASASKASAVYSSPVKRRAEKSPFQLEQESERERERLQKVNAELSRRAKMAKDKIEALEKRLLSEAEDEEVLKVRVELAGRNQEVGELRDRVRILEDELEAVTLTNSMNVSFDEPPPPPPEEEEGGESGPRIDIEELSRIRLEAEKWQNAALAAANVAIVAARSEDDALNNSIDVDTLMGRIEELEKEGWGDRLKRIEGENEELKGKVQRVEGELGVAIDEREELLTEKEHLNETLINKNDALESRVRAVEAENAHERARAIGIEQDLKLKLGKASSRETEGLRAELRSAEVERSSLQSRLAESVERVAALEKELEDGGRAVDTLKGERERLGSEHEILKETSSGLKKKLEAETEERNKLQSEIGSLSGQVESLMLEQSRLVDDNSFKSSQVEKLRGEVRLANEKCVELEKEAMTLGGEVNGLKDEVAGKDNFVSEMAITHKAVLAKLKVAQEKLGRENAGLMGKVERLMGKIENMELVVAERDEMKGEVRRLGEEVEELVKRLAEEQGRTRGADREREKKAEDVRRLDGELRNWEKEKEEWGWEKERLEEEIGRLDAEAKRLGDEKARAVAKLEKELEGSKKILQYEKEEIERLGGEVARMEAALGRVEGERGGLEKEVKRLSGEIEVGRGEFENKEKERRLEEQALKAELSGSRQALEATRSKLVLTQGELRMAAITAQDSERSVKELKARLEAVEVDYGLRVAELEGDARKWSQEKLELEHVNRTFKVKCDGFGVKLENLGKECSEQKRLREGAEERERAAEVEKEDLEKRLREGEVKLSKEVELKRAGQRREKNLKVDCEALSSEMVEMNGRIEEEEARARDKEKEVARLKMELEEAKVLLRKKTEWQRLHEERLQEEEVEHRGKVVDLEHKLRMSHGELKGLKMELRRSKGGWGGGVRGSGSLSPRRDDSFVVVGGGEETLERRGGIGGLAVSDLAASSRYGGRGGDDDDDLPMDISFGGGGGGGSGEGGGGGGLGRSRKEESIARQLLMERSQGGGGGGGG
ncbi:hypothetical protein TrST_g4093 [Triparma strigata]|uniref:Calmodulin n=1 Tax=Triparma strigata TaxID=1606541 RepID=A0A9W7AT12_9STRA|nr:hypothetical protein TrST_g4093 [Triparma strigata]